MSIALPTLEEGFDEGLPNGTDYDRAWTTNGSSSSVQAIHYLVSDTSVILWNLNEKLYFDRFLPATLYIGMTSLFGCIGNGIVVCVYNNQKRKSTASMFIFTLGIVDLLICMFVMPCKLFDMRFPLLFGFAALCKCFEFFEICLSMTSLILMLCIAFDRYFIVARPLKRMTMEKMNKIITLCPWIAILMSWPTFFLYGESKIKTSYPGITGSTCGLASHLTGGLIVKIWYFYLFGVFFIAFGILTGLYLRIWSLIRAWQSTHVGENVYNLAPRDQTTEIPNEGSLSTNNNVKLCRYVTLNGHSEMHDCTSSVTFMTVKREETCMSGRNSSNKWSRASFLRSSTVRSQPVAGSMNLNKFFNRSKKRDSDGIISIGAPGKRVRMRRNTLVFGAISIVFVLSYLPCLVILLLRMLQVYNVTSVPVVGARFAEVFIRSGYINHVLNPCIYSFLCPVFRKGFKEMMCKVMRVA